MDRVQQHQSSTMRKAAAKKQKHNKHLKHKESQRSMMGSLDLTEMFQEFEACVLEDIKKLGRPAYSYNFNHRNQTLNTIVNKSDLFKKLELIKSLGFTTTTLQRDLNIGGKSWSCEIIIAQLLNADNTRNETAGINFDPIASSLGLFASGLYYITFPNN